MTGQFRVRRLNIAIMVAITGAITGAAAFALDRTSIWRIDVTPSQKISSPSGPRAGGREQSHPAPKAVPLDILDPYELTLPPFHPDASLDRCIDQAEGYTLRTDACALAEIERQMPVMTALEHRIMSSSTPGTRRVFARPHSDWKLRIARKCDRDPDVVANEGGLLARMAFRFCYMDGVLDRIHWLRRHYHRVLA